LSDALVLEDKCWSGSAYGYGNRPTVDFYLYLFLQSGQCLSPVGSCGGAHYLHWMCSRMTG